ncbi:MAG: hypothetical protein ACO1SV_15900 [Fimbriimonas sp.]
MRQAWFELGGRWLAGLAGLLVFDLLVGVPVWVRWVGLFSLIVLPVFAILHIRGRIAKREFPEEHAARMVEEGHPELNNALINAVQFQRALDGAPDTQAGLMRREISRAEQAVATTSMDDVVSRQGERRARTILFAAMGAWIAGCALLPGVIFTILPRIFMPWMDDVTPPFSLTKIDINPKGATVRYGGTLVVSVALQGPVPESLTLGTRSGKREWSEVPLESTEPGKYAITLNGLREDTWIVAQGGGARSGRYLVRVVLPPVVQSMQATYTFPAYTALKETTEPVGENGVHGLRDTKVYLQITANRELTGGEFVFEPTEGAPQSFPLQIDPKDPRTAIAAFPITASGTFRVALASGDAQVNSDAAKGKVVLDRDQRPNVWFNEPPREIVVTPKMTVALDLEADDDNGVGRVDLHRVINGIADNEATVYEGEPVKRTGRRILMDMGDLGVRPGDEITYYANAYDNDPGRPNYAETEAYTIKVMSEEEYKQLLKDKRTADQLAREVADIKDALASLAERQRELAERMEKLAKELAAKPGDPKLQKAMEAAKQEQKKLQEEAERVAKQLEAYAKSPSGSQIEKALKEKVAEAAKELAQAASQAAKAAQSSNPAEAAQSAKQAAEAMRKTSGATEKSVGKSIENIEKVAPLYQDVERFKALLDRQGQLVLQARQFEGNAPKDAAARSKMDAIAAEQERIKEDLKTLQDDLRRHAADAQKDFPKAAASAVKIADEIGRRQIADHMASAQEGFSQERGEDGFASAAKALEQMQAMMGQGGACQSNGKGELDIKLSQSLGKPGLGQSLAECMSPGVGTGSGTGAGSGGQASGGAGTPSSGSAQGGAVAYTMSMQSLAGKSGSNRTQSQNRTPGTPAELSADRIEVLTKDAKTPPKASDGAGRGYPAEYRKLIKDYFISVTKEEKR